MNGFLVNIILALLAVAGMAGGVFFGKMQHRKAAVQAQIARKYKVQRDESRATARILVEHQDRVQKVREVGAGIVKEIQDAKSEADAVDIIARLTTDWNAGL